MARPKRAIRRISSAPTQAETGAKRRRILRHRYVSCNDGLVRTGSINAHSSDPKKPRGANHVPVAAPIEGGAVGPSSVASSGVAAPTAVDASQAATAAAVHRVAADKDSGERLAATPEVQSTSMRNPTASSAAHSLTIHLPLLASNVSRQRQYATSAPREHRRPLSVGFCSVHPVFAGTPSCKGSPT